MAQVAFEDLRQLHGQIDGLDLGQRLRQARDCWSDVTPRSAMPHGTISSKNSRSVLTLKAKPWLVIQREMRTPIAPIFSGPRVGCVTQAPVRPGTRPRVDAEVARRRESSPLRDRGRSDARPGDRA